MTNVLLNIYEFQAPWAMEYLRNILHGDQQVAILTMSHGDEIPDGKVWKNLYGPGKEIYRVLTGAFGAYGIPEEGIRFVSWFHDTPDTALQKIGEAGVLFLTGGLPDVFCDRLEQRGLVEPIRQFPGIVMGCSAGAMMQMTEYHITPDEDYDSYGYYKGLGLLDGFEPEVHYAGSSVQKESIARYLRERRKKLYAMTNQGGLLIENGKITMMGDVTEFLPTDPHCGQGDFH